MATKSKSETKGSKSTSEEQTGAGKEPRSLKIAEKGIKTGHDFANLMSALMTDLISGRITPATGNAACNAGGKLLKAVEMQHKYGTQAGNTGKKTLTLAFDEARENVKQLETGEA